MILAEHPLPPQGCVLRLPHGGSSHTCAGTEPPVWSSRFLSGFLAVAATGGQLGGGCAALGQVQSEEFRKITGGENGRGIGSFFCHSKVLASATDEFVFVQLVKPKKKFGLPVEARANAVEYSGDMFAHVSPVGTTAGEINLLCRGK